MNKRILWITVLWIVLLFGGCGKNNSQSIDKTNKLQIVTTLFPQYDFARQIAGEYADVSLLLLPGMESHMYDPTPGDMAEISKADLFIYTGEEMEPWAHELTDSIDMTSVLVVDASKGIEMLKEEHHDEEEEEETEHGHHHHAFDPHIWLDLENAAQMIQTIEEALCERDPLHADDYRKNADKYRQACLELDKEIHQIVENGHRKEIVFGGRFAYGYFIHAYEIGCETVYDSCSADTEPSIAQMAHVIEHMQEENVHYILYEELATPNVARAIADTVDAQMLLFSTCHNVTRDEFESGITFLELMTRNAETLRLALE